MVSKKYLLSKIDEINKMIKRVRTDTANLQESMHALMYLIMSKRTIITNQHIQPTSQALKTLQNTLKDCIEVIKEYSDITEEYALKKYGYCGRTEYNLQEFQEEHLTKCLEKIEEGIELHHKMDTRLGWNEQNPKLSLEGKTSEEVAFKDAYDRLRADAVLKLLEDLDVFLPNINKNLEVFEEALGDYLHC
ncbi:hypothetical protein [Helicobacter suis]|uniref:hypothetical protein n=1 Tax=Helicobacter suis TaxID=104628 RepID=UPI0013D65681|nr:hypothetical protein [Helicobacter suis]